MYFTKTSGTSNNKVFMDFEHNWKQGNTDVTATFAGVNLTGSSLSVTYKTVNYQYQRTDGSSFDGLKICRSSVTLGC